MRLQWQDLRFVDRSPASCRLKLKEGWRPDVHVYKGETLVKRLDEMVTIGPEGQVRYRQRPPLRECPR